MIATATGDAAGQMQQARNQAEQVQAPVVRAVAGANDDAGARDLAAVKYFSPVFRLEVDTQTAILEFRDPVTGEVRNQFPSRQQLEAYRNAITGIDPGLAGSAQDVIARTDPVTAARPVVDPPAPPAGIEQGNAQDPADMSASAPVDRLA